MNSSLAKLDSVLESFGPLPGKRRRLRQARSRSLKLKSNAATKLDTNNNNTKFRQDDNYCRDTDADMERRLCAAIGSRQLLVGSGRRRSLGGCGDDISASVKVNTTRNQIHCFGQHNIAADCLEDEDSDDNDGDDIGSVCGASRLLNGCARCASSSSAAQQQSAMQFASSKLKAKLQIAHFDSELNLSPTIRQAADFYYQLHESGAHVKRIHTPPNIISINNNKNNHSSYVQDDEQRPEKPHQKQNQFCAAELQAKNDNKSQQSNEPRRQKEEREACAKGESKEPLHKSRKLMLFKKLESIECSINNTNSKTDKVHYPAELNVSPTAAELAADSDEHAEKVRAADVVVRAHESKDLNARKYHTNHKSPQTTTTSNSPEYQEQQQSIINNIRQPHDGHEQQQQQQKQASSPSELANSLPANNNNSSVVHFNTTDATSMSMTTATATTTTSTTTTTTTTTPATKTAQDQRTNNQTHTVTIAPQSLIDAQAAGLTHNQQQHHEQAASYPNNTLIADLNAFHCDLASLWSTPTFVKKAAMSIGTTKSRIKNDKRQADPKSQQLATVVVDNAVSKEVNFSEANDNDFFSSIGNNNNNTDNNNSADAKLTYKMPEAIEKAKLTLSCEEYDGTIGSLTSDIRYKLHMLLYRRVQLIWIITTTIFCTLVPIVFTFTLSQSPLALIFGAWLSLQAIGIAVSSCVRSKLDEILEKAVARANGRLMNHNLMIGVINVGGLFAKAKLSIPLLYFETRACSKQIESIIDKDSRKVFTSGDSNCAILDYARLGVQLPPPPQPQTADSIGNTNASCSGNEAIENIANKVVLRFSQRWISLYDRHKLAFSERASPRHLSTGKCLCQFVEEHFQQNSNTTTTTSTRRHSRQSQAIRKISSLSCKSNPIYIQTSNSYIKTSQEQTVMSLAASKKATAAATVVPIKSLSSHVVNKQHQDYNNNNHHQEKRKHLRANGAGQTYATSPPVLFNGHDNHKTSEADQSLRFDAGRCLPSLFVATTRTDSCLSISTSSSASSSSTSSSSSSSSSASESSSSLPSCPSSSTESSSISGDSGERPTQVSANDARENCDVGSRDLDDDNIAVDDGDLVAKLRSLLESRKDQLNAFDGVLFSNLLYREKQFALNNHLRLFDTLHHLNQHKNNQLKTQSSDFSDDCNSQMLYNTSTKTTPQTSPSVSPPTSSSPLNQKHQKHFVHYLNTNGIKQPPSHHHFNHNDQSHHHHHQKTANRNHIVEIC